MRGCLSHLRGLPVLSFLDSPTGTLLVIPEKENSKTLLHLCEQLEWTQLGEYSGRTGPHAWL